MKPTYQLLLCALVFTITTSSFSQVGIGTTTPNVSSILDITSTTAGLLTPRMTAAQKTAIATPATGLLIYQTDGTAGFYYYNGSAWTPFGSSGWALTGNAGTTPTTNFLGTTDAQDVVIKTNSTEAIRVKNGGNVGIGTTSPTAKFQIEGTGLAAPTYTQDFEATGAGGITTSSATNPYQIVNGGTCASTNDWNIGTDTWTSCTTCNNKRAYIKYNSGCSQNATLVVGPYAATSTSLTVTFNYGYYDFSGGDSFVATVYNNTTSTVTSTLFTATASALDQTFTSGAITVVNGNNYTIRFQYIGNNDWGASVDNVSLIFGTSGAPVLRIVDGTQGAGKVLTSDATGNTSWATPALGTDSQSLSISGSNLSISGGNTVALPTNSYTFTNGLTNTAGTVKLGGTLTEATTIGATAYDLNVSSAGKTTMLQVDFDENVVKFGHDSTPYDDGSAKTIDGNATTVDYMTSAYNGSSRGTTVGVGSLEYFTDGEASIASSDSFLPITTFLNLGSASSRWNTLYSVNVVNVSDANLKKNINPLNYGLKELMQLKPVKYNWKDNKIGVTTIPENLQETKLGFLAQDLLKVLPEVVKTHDWKITDERTKVYEYKKNEVMGVMYSDIIPVTVKAIQEQQAEIEALKKTTEDLKTVVEELKKQNELLLQLVNKK